jgi:hypothetical protein
LKVESLKRNLSYQNLHWTSLTFRQLITYSIFIWLYRIYIVRPPTTPGVFFVIPLPIYTPIPLPCNGGDVSPLGSCPLKCPNSGHNPFCNVFTKKFYKKFLEKFWYL